MCTLCIYKDGFSYLCNVQLVYIWLLTGLCVDYLRLITFVVLVCQNDRCQIFPSFKKKNLSTKSVESVTVPFK